MARHSLLICSTILLTLSAVTTTSQAEDAVLESLVIGESVIEGTAFATADAASQSGAETYQCAPSCWEQLLASPTLTGDWCGARTAMAEHGIIYQGYLTQFYQGPVSGGTNRQFEYGGKSDQFFTFLGEKMGLWKGLIVSMHTETRFGQDANLNAVGLAPVNVNMLWPSLEQTTAISGFTVTQMLSEEWLVSAGKFNLLDLFNSMYPQGGRGIDGFMNASTLFPLSAARPLNLSVNGVSLAKLHEGKVQASLAVIDTNNSATTVGLGDLFDSGAAIIAYGRHFTEFRDLPGSHAILGEYSTKTFFSIDPSDFYFIPPTTIVAGTQSGSWALNYFGEQQVWVDACDPKRNVGLFTSWGISDGNPNPIRWSGTVSLQGHGLIEGRPADAAGIAYFYTGLSSDFQRLLSPAVDLRDVQGVEMYYNAAITPWFNLTPDLQIIQPANVGNDTAVVFGMRAKLTF